MRSKKRSKKKFLLVLYNFIKSNERLPAEKECGKSKQSLNYYVRQLKKEDSIYSPSYSVWKIRSKKEVKKKAVTTARLDKILRMHSVQLVCRLPHFEYWNRIEIYLKKKDIKYTKTRDNKIRIEHYDVIFHICSNSIMFYFPSGWNILASDPQQCDARALAKGRECLDKLRSHLGIDFRIRGDYILNITRSKTAWVNNEIAATAHKKGDKIYCRYKGKLWLMADRSFNVNELEFLDHKEKNRDIKVVVEPLMNKLRDNPEILDKVENKIDQLTRIVEKQNKVIEHLIEKDQRSINIDKFKY